MTTLIFAVIGSVISVAGALAIFWFLKAKSYGVFMASLVGILLYVVVLSIGINVF